MIQHQAFAAVLDGPSADLLKDLINAAIMPLLLLMQDPYPQVVVLPHTWSCERKVFTHARPSLYRLKIRWRGLLAAFAT